MHITKYSDLMTLANGMYSREVEETTAHEVRVHRYCYVECGVRGMNWVVVVVGCSTSHLDMLLGFAFHRVVDVMGFVHAPPPSVGKGKGFFRVFLKRETGRCEKCRKRAGAWPWCG
jgi:hypothetical protein